MTNENEDTSDIAPMEASKVSKIASKYRLLKPSFTKKLSIAFILILLASGGVAVYVLTMESNTIVLDPPSSQLSDADFAKLTAGDLESDDSGKLVNIRSSAKFGGSISVADDVLVGGQLALAGPLALEDLIVSETALVADFTATGNVLVQGNLQIDQSIDVAGNATINGNVSVANSITAATVSVDTLSARNVSFTGDITLQRHLVSSGGSIGASSGGAIGAGGTVNASGTDAAGTITINTGSSSTTGTLATVSFKAQYAKAPRIIITAHSSAAATSDIYIVRGTSGFSFVAATNPPDGQTLQFDYHVIQ